MGGLVIRELGIYVCMYCRCGWGQNEECGCCGVL